MGRAMETLDNDPPDDVLSGDVLSDEPVMPEIPLKPNKAIPITIGVLMVIGALFLLISSVGEIYTHYAPRSDQYYEQMATSFSYVGIETNASEVEQWDDAFQERNYHLIAGFTTLIPVLGIGAAGVMFCMRRRVAIKVGAASSITYVVISMLVTIYWASSIESSVGISMSTPYAVIESIMGIVCSMFCIALPFIPLLVAAGNAALKPPK